MGCSVFTLELGERKNERERGAKGVVLEVKDENKSITLVYF